MTTIDKSQLPEGAQKASGNTKNAVGVLEEGFVPDNSVLARQAEAFLERRNSGVAYQQGAAIPAEVVERVAENAFKGMVNLNEQTINSLQSGDVTRDGTFTGNNAGFTGYYLEPGAKFVIPQMTPLRNMTPRESLPGIDTINWRTVLDYFGGTGPTVAAAAISQFGTPNALSYQFANLSNVAKMMTVRDSVTFESELYGKMFQGDVRATVASKLIPALMQEEEIWLINSGQRLWSPAPPNTAAVTNSGGSLVAATYWVIVTAVNANGETLALGTTATVPQALSFTTTGGASSATFNINTVPSAVSYRVYVGQGATQPANSAMWLQGAANQFGAAGALNQPTTIIKQGYFSVTFGVSNAALTSGTAYSTVVSAGNTAVTVVSADSNTSGLPLTFDGAQALLYTTYGTASTLGIKGETPLIVQPSAVNGSLALSDIDTQLENMFLSAHADPDYMFVSIKDHKKLSNLVAQGTNFRVTQQIGAGMTDLTAGQRVTKYINQTTGKIMDVIMLPYLGQGTIMIGSFSIPFPVSSIDKAPFRVAVNREMWAVEYPPDQSHFTQWAYAAYMNETLINQYLGGWSLINGISLS